MSRDTRSRHLGPLRDLIIVGNMMAMKIGQEPLNLVNTWDEMIERLRQCGILEIISIAMLERPGTEPEPEDWIAHRWEEAEARNSMPCWRALAERLALECLGLENDGKPVPIELRKMADDAYQRYLDLHPKR